MLLKKVVADSPGSPPVFHDENNAAGADQRAPGDRDRERRMRRRSRQGNKRGLHLDNLTARRPLGQGGCVGDVYRGFLPGWSGRASR